MDARSFLKELAGGSDYQGQLVHIRMLQARPADYAEPATPLPGALGALLRRRNIHRLYTHQAAALDAVEAERDVVIVTSTASGKTLCYNLAVARTLLAEPDARALYLFPTKALAQDQFGVLRDWSTDPALKDVLQAAVYDGDTPSHNRTRIRNQANVVLTNPDMLHVGMLPYHGKWHAFLRQLRYIVVDELHSYRGIFGSHVAGVLRRLLRMCAHYGSHPQIICCSATIANPVELAERLTGRSMALVDNDGAPRGHKYFALWNPPLLADDGLSRRSANVEAVELLTRLVRLRAQTIVFTKARIVSELVYKYAVERLRESGQADLAERVRPYRGGYLPSERREIEQALFSGQLLAVASTNALELGIDVGGLDAAILVGFPGTICSTWQQAGRAGRASQDSLVILVGYNEPVDQYLMRHPDYLFGASHEHGVIDPYNPHILEAQVSCACFEKPLGPEDAAWFGPLAEGVARIIAEEGDMKALGGRYYWSRGEGPARRVSLRMISQDSYTIADLSQGERVIGQVDTISAPELVYPNAVYLHEGRSYLVRQLDVEARIARVEPVEVDYYTQSVLASSCRLEPPDETTDYLGGPLQLGPGDVTWQTTAFRKVKYYTMELVGQTELDLPSQTLPTIVLAWVVADELRQMLKKKGHNPIEALMGLRNLMLAALPSLAMCDRRDISGMVESSNLGAPTIILYDRYPGGLGFAQIAYDRIATLLEMSRRIVTDCPCATGCPSCVGLANLRPPIHGDPDLGSGYPVPDKQATLRLLEGLRELEKSQPAPQAP